MNTASVERARLPSLETRWLQRSEKWLPQPAVFRVSDCGTGAGFYLHPWPEGEYEVVAGSGVYAHLPHGALVIGAASWGGAVTQDESMQRSTLAHEWRHHWQRWSGWRFDSQPPAWEWAEWESSIALYYLRSRVEADALRFELARAPSDLTDEHRRCVELYLQRLRGGA